MTNAAPLSEKSGVGITIDDIASPTDVAERVQELLEGAHTFGRRIEIIIDQGGRLIDPRGRGGYQVRSYHEPLSTSDPMLPPSVQR